MSITCNVILSKSQLSNIKLIAGKEDLEKPVRWTHLVESVESVKFLQGNDLVFTTGMHMKDNPDKLLELIRALHTQKSVGLVVNIGKYIKRVPEEAIKCANELNFPLMELPWKYKLVDITRIIGQLIVENDFKNNSVAHLLENILFSPDENYEDYIISANYHGYDINSNMRIATIYFPNLKDYLLKQDIVYSKQQFQLIVQGMLGNILERHNKKCMYLWRDYSVIMTVPVDREREIIHVDTIFNDIKNNICSRFSSLITHIGLGSDHKNISKMRQSYREAVFCLKLCKEYEHSACILYRSAGIYKLLNKINNRQILKDFFIETLGDLIVYDQENNTEFLETLCVYFDENENTQQTVSRLFVHRNTLKYRLKRIEEILGFSLTDAEEKMNIQIAFKIRKYLELISI